MLTTSARSEMPYKPLALLAAVFLFLALAPLPYGYYTLLRLVVFGVTAYGAFRAVETGQTAWFLVLAVLALLFNPVLPVPLGRELWRPIDAIAAIVVLVSGFVIREQQKPNPSAR